jgi:hypothetical protein
MDDDPVLRTLAADLERDDPGLAAFLDGRTRRGRTRRPHRHGAAWLLLALPLLLPALLLPARQTIALVAMLLILASPGLVLWLCADLDGPTNPRT